MAVRPSQVSHLSSHAAGISTSAVQLGGCSSPATLNGGIVYQPQVSRADGFVRAASAGVSHPAPWWRGLADGVLERAQSARRKARAAFDPDVIVAGKTGDLLGRRLVRFLHAPADRPEVVVVVLRAGRRPRSPPGVAGRIYRNLYKPAAPPLAVGGGK